MTRHTTFKFCLDPTVEQKEMLARHAGASRFAFNQSLYFVKAALSQRKTDPGVDVPWTGYDLINAFNAWKKTEAAGRVFDVDMDGVTEVEVTGLVWRHQVCQQVFQEAAVDCGRALAAWSESRRGVRKGRRVGFPRFKKKAGDTPSFRLRNKYSKKGTPAIRVGECHPRSVTLPGVGRVRVRNDTRRLRRLIARDRGKILFATVTCRAGRWWVSLNVEAAEFHLAMQHVPREDDDCGGWIGLDRGLATFVVAAAADGREVGRVANPPRALVAGLKKQRRLAKSLSRKEKGSNNRRLAAAQLARHHRRVRNIRHHFLHDVSNELVKTHDRLVLEDLNVAGMLTNHHLAQAITDASWGEFARQLHYKQRWRGGEIAIADRWYPSSQICSLCQTRNDCQPLSKREFTCGCGHAADCDRNAAVNLAQWGEANYVHHRTPDPRAGGRVNNARRRGGADRCPMRIGETSLDDAGTDVHPATAV